jgi:DNA-3-methyladenine glycosylase
MILARHFYERPATEVAPDLLGKYLVFRGRDGKIVETEAYMGVGDLASHAKNGPTPRSKIMFGPAGFSYIYMIYGMYFCLNITCQKEGKASAVLIRAIEQEGCNGPGKLCKTLKISLSENNLDMTREKLYIEDRGESLPKNRIKQTPRVGVEYAGSYAKKPWRFVVGDSQYLSRKYK